LDFRFHGALVGMDFDFGLAAGDFCFISIADICNPSYAPRLLPAARVSAIYQQTKVIKDAYGHNGQRFVNAGIPLDQVRQVTHQNIQPMRISEAASIRDSSLRADRTMGGALTVYRPKIAVKPPQRTGDVMDDLLGSKPEPPVSRQEHPARVADVMDDLLTSGHPSPQKPAHDSSDATVGRILDDGHDTPVRVATSAQPPDRVNYTQYPSGGTSSPQSYHPVVQPESHSPAPPVIHPPVRPDSHLAVRPAYPSSAQPSHGQVQPTAQERERAAREERTRLLQMQQARTRAVTDRQQKLQEQSSKELQNPKRNPNNPF
jgi:hypothetical protein